jgi:hypothetical protein
MKLYFLILSALLMIGCGNGAPEPNFNVNSNRAPRTPVKTETPQMDAELEARLLQKIQEFISVNYPEWTLKGTADLATSPIELHIIQGLDEKIVKINYKELNDLNGQPYIVISKFSETDLTNTNTNVAQPESEVNTSTNSNSR